MPTEAGAKGQARVLFVANDPPGAAVYRYRCENLADVLRACGWQADVASVGDGQIRVDHDVVVLHRICAVAEGRALARAARACGATLVYGADDLVFEAEAFTDPGDARKRRFAPLHAAMARDADAVLVSTEFLAGQVRAAFGGDKPVVVARNFLSPELERLSKTARDQRGKPTEASDAVTIGYGSGTPTHDADLASIALPLADVLHAHPNAILTLIGPVAPPPPIATALGDRLRRLPFVDWKALPDTLARLDINLAPLDLTRRFNQAKSEIKMLEAGAVGIPTIASASAGFREALTPDPMAGLLAETPDDWRRLLKSLVTDAEARADAGCRAHAFARRYATADAQRAPLDAIFRQLAALPRQRPGQPVATVVRRNPLTPKNIARRALQLLKR